MGKRKANAASPTNDSSIEIIPPPSTEPAKKKQKVRSLPGPVPTNFAAHLKARRARSSASTSTNARTKVKPANRSTSARIPLKPIEPTNAGPAPPEDDSSSSDDDNSATTNPVQPSAAAPPAPSMTPFAFKSYLSSCVDMDQGAARQETNLQGGKGPAARSRSKGKASRSTSLGRPPLAKSNEYRVGRVVVLPYGVRKPRPENRNKYGSPFSIRKSECIINDLFSYLRPIGFAIRRDVGFVFCEDWDEDRVYAEIQSLLPQACELLMDAYSNADPSSRPERPWLPCYKPSSKQETVVTKAEGPYTGASFREIGRLFSKSRYCAEDTIVIVSTVQIDLGDEDNDIDHRSDSEAETTQDDTVDADRDDISTIADDSDGANSYVPPGSSKRRLRPRPINKGKQKAIELSSDEDLDFGSGFDTGRRRKLSPGPDLSESFYDFSIGSHSANCTGLQAPRKAAYRPLPP
ncbi:hypothetical protein CVT24_008270 [Panaeolus cyanescens]|uniref:Uncharacterized protein n=1 Tax=Panaeolus cyanescens TaxID=181874 RepID=A0A409W0H0_9AGAR|nr:hypothetical protein CVT24_008270 [Panaeolus cyanescens]